MAKASKWKFNQLEINNKIEKIPKNIKLEKYLSNLYNKKIDHISSSDEQLRIEDQIIDGANDDSHGRKNRIKKLLVKKRNQTISKLIEYDPEYRPPDNFLPEKRSKDLFLQEDCTEGESNMIFLYKCIEEKKKIENITHTKIMVSNKASNSTVQSNVYLQLKNSLSFIRVIGDFSEDIDNALRLIKKTFDKISQTLNQKKLKNQFNIKHNIRSNSSFCYICKKKNHNFFSCFEKDGLNSIFEIKKKNLFLSNNKFPRIRVPLSFRVKNEYEIFLNQVYNIKYKNDLYKRKKTKINSNKFSVILWNSKNYLDNKFLKNKLLPFGLAYRTRIQKNYIRNSYIVFFLIIFNFLPNKYETYFRMVDKSYFNSIIKVVYK